MKKEDISETLNEVDSKMVENAYKKKQNPAWRKWLALAACLVLSIGAAIALPIIPSSSLLPNSLLFKSPLPDIPVWDASHFPAADLLANYSMDGGTTSYTKVHAPDSAYLYLNDVPKDGYLRIFQGQGASTPIDKAEFQTFADNVLPKLAAALGIEVPEYSIKEHSITDSLSVSPEVDPYDLLFDHDDRATWVTFSKKDSNDPLMVLDGNPVQVDQHVSDEEILTSLEGVKKELFEIFGVSFSSQKVVRRYTEFHQNGAESIRIYYYDESAHYLNQVSRQPISDYICIYFDNYDNLDGMPVSDSILQVVTIDYWEYRRDVNDRYALVAQAKQLTRAEAERLLRKGYVLDTACPTCSSRQAEVTFDSYDFVSLEYRSLIPVYAFYKIIGNAPNGNTTYAKVYVPAIEIDGYEEYFIERHKEHEEKSK